MARKEKLTLDYFPHYAIQGDIVNVIQETYGNDGYAVLHKNYEQFCLRDKQYIDLSEYSTLATVAAYCKVSKDRYLEIVEELVKLGAYDKELWTEKRILASEKFIENTKDAYKKRLAEIPKFDDLKNNFLQKSTNKCISSDGNQQIKLNKTKLNEIKENNICVCVLNEEENEKNTNTHNPDLVFNSDVNKFKTEYSKIFNKKPCLHPEDMAKICELTQTIEDFWIILPSVLSKLKNKTFRFRDGTVKKPSAQWLLEGRNFAKVANEDSSECTQEESESDFLERKRREWEDKNNA